MTGPTCTEVANDCETIQAGNPKAKSGVYTIVLPSGKQVKVFCEMKRFGGGWTVIQRRLNGMGSFYLGETEYNDGFGSIFGAEEYGHNYWFGNDNINDLTTSPKRMYNVLFAMSLRNGKEGLAYYSQFSVGKKANEYPMKYGGFACGKAGNSLNGANKQEFQTKEYVSPVIVDGEVMNCAQHYKGAWWYNTGDVCKTASNLNGLHATNSMHGMFWETFTGKLPATQSLETSEIMVRSVNRECDCDNKPTSDPEC